jgi:site-specific recombinase XerD
MQPAATVHDAEQSPLFERAWLPVGDPTPRSNAPLLAMIAVSIDPQLTLVEARELVDAALRHDTTRSAATRTVQSTEVGRFWRYLSHCDIDAIHDITPEITHDFVHGAARSGTRWGAPAGSTQRNRRAAVRYVFEVLRGVGFVVGDPTLDLTVNEVRARQAAHVTDATMERLQAAAPHELVASRRAVVLALAQAGAANTEIIRIHTADVNVADGTVALPGGTRLAPRTNRLTGWGRHVLAEVLVASHDADVLLITVGASSAASTVSNTMSDLCQAAGIRPKVTVESVRAWRARRLFEHTHSIEDVARFLGTRSLDVACDVVDHRWRVRS